MTDKEIKMIIGLKIKVQISCFVLVQISYFFWSKFPIEFFKHTGLPCNFLHELVKYINNLWVLHIDLFAPFAFSFFSKKASVNMACHMSTHGLSFG